MRRTLSRDPCVLSEVRKRYVRCILSGGVRRHPPLATSLMPALVRRRFALAVALTCSALLTGAVPLVAQSSAKATASQAKTAAKSPSKSTAPSMLGSWSGKATVPLPDSAIVVPVFYTFTETAGAMGGTAMVPGQGSGPISNVVRTGNRVQFRVTAPEGRLLEHDGTFGPDGAIEGMVQMNKQPLATFRIVPRPPAKTAK